MLWTKETKKNLKILSERGSATVLKTKPVLEHVRDYIRMGGGHVNEYRCLQLPGGNYLVFKSDEPKQIGL